MADKSFWQGIGNKFGAGTQGAAPLPTSARKCPRGHALSGAWKECPYCKAEDNASSPSARANTGFARLSDVSWSWPTAPLFRC